MLFEIAVMRPILMTVKEPNPIKPQKHPEVLKVPFVGETAPLLEYSRQQLDQSAHVVHFFSTAYERPVRLLAHATTTKSTAPASE